MAPVQLQRNLSALSVCPCGLATPPAPSKVPQLKACYLRRSNRPVSRTILNSSVRTSSTYVESDTQQHTKPQKQQPAVFNWYRAWYPVAVLEDLDADIPQPISLLGMNLVLWRDKNHHWR